MRSMKCYCHLGPLYGTTWLSLAQSGCLMGSVIRCHLCLLWFFFPQETGLLTNGRLPRLTISNWGWACNMPSGILALSIARHGQVTHWGSQNWRRRLDCLKEQGARPSHTAASGEGPNFLTAFPGESEAAHKSLWQRRQFCSFTH